MPTIYASTDPVTLNAEAYYKGCVMAGPKADFNAQLMVGMHWELQAVVDLTAPATLQSPEGDQQGNCQLRLGSRTDRRARTGDAGDRKGGV